jgi:uncharacterized integral membrane protein (TIGR00697 family)
MQVQKLRAKELRGQRLRLQKLRAQSVFFVLGAFFVALLIASNLLATKQVELFGWIMPAAAFVFPFNFMLGDVITELFGFKNTRLVIIVGFIVQIVITLVTLIGIFLPYPAFYQNQEAYAAIFLVVPRIVLASLIAYIFSETINAKIMAMMKARWSNAPFFTRTIGSTLVGQVFDSALFISVAFLGTMPVEAVLQMIVVQYVVKCGTEVVFGTPLAYGLRSFVTKRIALEA